MLLCLVNLQSTRSPPVGLLIPGMGQPVALMLDEILEPCIDGQGFVEVPVIIDRVWKLCPVDTRCNEL